MKNPTLAALFTGLALVDSTQAIIPRHIVRNFLAARDDSTDAGTPDPFTNSVAIASLPCSLTLSGIPPASSCLVTDTATIPASSGYGSVFSQATPSIDPESALGSALSSVFIGLSDISNSLGATPSTDPGTVVGGSFSSFSATVTGAPVSSDIITTSDALSGLVSAISSLVSGLSDLSGTPEATPSTNLETVVSSVFSSPSATLTDAPVSSDASTSSDAFSGLGSALTSLVSGLSDLSSAPEATITPSASDSTALAPLTSASASTSLDFTSSSFVISGSITIPPQTAIESGSFQTTTLTDKTGPPGSFSATTTTDSDNNPTILPVWFNSGGFPIIVIPDGNNGPPGIIPPPPGLPPVVFDPAGNPVPAPDSDPGSSPTPTPNPTPTDSPSVSASASTDGISQTESTSSSSSTSTAATEAPTPFLIFPKDSASQSDKDKFQSDLANQVGGDSNIDTLVDDEEGLIFWEAPLNSSQVADFSKNPIIDAVLLDRRLPMDYIGDETAEADDDDATATTDDSSPAKLVKRALQTQQNANPELAILSQGPGQPLPKVPTDFVFDDTAGRGITIFVIDTGANAQHVEFTGMPGSKSFIPAGADRDQDDKHGHGSCVLSMATSPSFGAAKNADVVVVKVDFFDDEDGFEIELSSFLRALQKVINAVTANNGALKGKAVVNMSFGVRELDTDELTKYTKRMTKLNRLDVVMVTGAGNDAKRGRPEVDSHPALFNVQVSNSVVVVGATKKSGQVAQFSQGGPLVDLFAPGNDIDCMPKDGTTGTRKGSGTSYASPKVAGLAAYLMALPDANFPAGQVASAVKARLVDLSFPRILDAPENVAWNGISAGCDPGAGGSANKRDGGSCSFSASASGSSTSTESGTLAPTTFSTIVGPPPESSSSSSTLSSIVPLITDLLPPPSLTIVSSATPTQTTGPAINCDACQNNLGASNCAADDNNCLLKQCQTDTACQACNFDCNTIIA